MIVQISYSSSAVMLALFLTVASILLLGAKSLATQFDRHAALCHGGGAQTAVRSLEATAADFMQRHQVLQRYDDIITLQAARYDRQHLPARMRARFDALQDEKHRLAVHFDLMTAPAMVKIHTQCRRVAAHKSCEKPAAGTSDICSWSRDAIFARGGVENVRILTFEQITGVRLRGAFGADRGKTIAYSPMITRRYLAQKLLPEQAQKSQIERLSFLAEGL